MHRTALLAALLILLRAGNCGAAELIVRDMAGMPLAGVMVTRASADGDSADTSDNGYPAESTRNIARPRSTRFTDPAGTVRFADSDTLVTLVARKPGYRDLRLDAIGGAESRELLLEPETDAVALAAQKPSNLWLSLLDFDGDEAARKHFLLHCAFCHQQASPFMRAERSTEQWRDTIDRMNRYGAQLAADHRKPLASYLQTRFAELRASPELLPDFEPWGPHLANVEITEWAIGDAFSQMHDFLLHPNGLVYVGDNLMDRLYELDPLSGEYRVYKVPRPADARPGGILGNRLAGGYPKVDNAYGLHSLALSPRDGHIFITPSMQQSLLEFDPVQKRFIEWPMDEGFYPHTIRVDAEDRVWFTLALSSQVAMFDRAAQRFTYYDLRPRSLRERIVLWIAQWRLARGAVSEPPDYDEANTGFPMPYGIDIAPDGSVWVARLYADDIARIDPASGEVQMIQTPFHGPRRLRVDARGDPWMVGFSSGLIARYDVAAGRFETFDLPLLSEAPYALNVDRRRDVVWVNGNQSDTLLAFDIATSTWKVYPLSRYRSFTRDVEIAEDGSVFTTNSHFPSWQIEDGKPTLIRLTERPDKVASP